MAKSSPTRPKRILIIRNAARYDFGGAERFPVDLSSELAKHGFTPIVVSRSAKTLEYAAAKQIRFVRGWWWPKQNFSGRRIVFIPVYCIWQLLLTLWYVVLVVRLRPTVVHPQSKDDFIAATIAGRLLGKKIVWTDHADLKYILANHRIWYKNPIGKLVYACSKLAFSITLVSQSEKHLVEAELGQQLPPTWTVIHNGVTDTTVSPHIRTAAEQDKIIFCATSRLVTAKGIGELIAAFRVLYAQNPHALLWLVGGGPEMGKFKQLAADIPAIRFLGHLDDALAYVAACDIFVHPSYHEGFSLSIIEAAMLGRPIIACEVGGNSEIITSGTTGLLVPASDSHALSDAMINLMQNPELRQQFGHAARQRYLHEFRFDQIVEERFIPIYEN